ncbi:sulfurtransferase [uncultured Winogradskyella sp.]|uniref:sulfurtransferase n=1 Tax=uncultured Winogradskyella sp. TaxID=395353 RepID=UPI00262146EF|nr:sulfurtransferase [uncultured Winogradskyella sp.]
MKKLREIVSAKWLNKNLSKPNLIVLDASIESNASGKEFEEFDCTIPGARRFDLKNVFLDKSSPFPDTVPKPQEFELQCRRLGINQNSEIIVFENNGIYSSPRVWWLFNVMGHKEIFVLDGGLLNWIKEGFQTENEHLETFQTGNFKAKYNESLVVKLEQIKENTIQKKFLIADARSEGRFNGTESEPRRHLKSGKIPNSVNIPFQEVLNNGKFKTKNQLRELFEGKCGGEKELVFSCGSGLTACIIMLANKISYGNSLRIYDGSWTEWAELNNLKNII